MSSICATDSSRPRIGLHGLAEGCDSGEAGYGLGPQELPPSRSAQAFLQCCITALRTTAAAIAILIEAPGTAKGLRLAQKIWRLRDLRISLTLSHARNINIRPLEGPPVAGAAFLFPQSAEAPVRCGRAQQSTRPTLHSHDCLYVVAAGGAGRTSTHGPDFFFSASGSLLIADW